MALTVERKNMILEKLRSLPPREWRAVDPSDLDQREAICYIIDNDQLEGHDVVFSDDTFRKIIKVPRRSPVITEWTGLGLPDDRVLPPFQRMKIFCMNLRPNTTIL